MKRADAALQRWFQAPTISNGTRRGWKHEGCNRLTLQQQYREGNAKSNHHRLLLLLLLLYQGGVDIVTKFAKRLCSCSRSSRQYSCLSVLLSGAIVMDSKWMMDGAWVSLRKSVYERTWQVKIKKRLFIVQFALSRENTEHITLTKSSSKSIALTNFTILSAESSHPPLSTILIDHQNNIDKKEPRKIGNISGLKHLLNIYFWGRFSVIIFFKHRPFFYLCGQSCF